MRHLRLVRAAHGAREDLRRVQLRDLRGTLRGLRGAGDRGRFLLHGVHDSGEGCELFGGNGRKESSV